MGSRKAFSAGQFATQSTGKSSAQQATERLGQDFAPARGFGRKRHVHRPRERLLRIHATVPKTTFVLWEWLPALPPRTQKCSQSRRIYGRKHQLKQLVVFTGNSSASDGLVVYPPNLS
mmetsp:Transcript_14124/g.32881  ORF Transcript_14124/g.32881 Transcript_14124/m.32881 type:complete len:118 (-) Transcript_14124:55-408(-)